jgi:hypothetical protein
LIATTTSEASRVSLTAATACAFVIASQNSPGPPPSAFETTAARGRRTISER